MKFPRTQARLLELALLILSKLCDWLPLMPKFIRLPVRKCLEKFWKFLSVKLLRFIPEARMGALKRMLSILDVLTEKPTDLKSITEFYSITKAQDEEKN